MSVILTFTACDPESNKQKNTPKTEVQNTQDISDNESASEDKESISDTAPIVQKTHTEYVETYFIYAEQGAVVTWFDSKTGEFSYKGKCETCGETESGTHNGLRVGINTTYNGSYCCQNAKCSNWGKSQPVKIGCKVTGEWIEVYD